MCLSLYGEIFPENNNHHSFFLFGNNRIFSKYSLICLYSLTSSLFSLFPCKQRTVIASFLVIIFQHLQCFPCSLYLTFQFILTHSLNVPLSSISPPYIYSTGVPPFHKPNVNFYFLHLRILLLLLRILLHLLRISPSENSFILLRILLFLLFLFLLLLRILLLRILLLRILLLLLLRILLFF
ncbi:unnamed protein product [Acanthosepion pharaonis]|uniref:Uncharacterized protein n=1 Tax=Acanthosepion pharaonis TaxID=158019 RepID=A0A812AKQ0_ACAPH|nr:unnamed protein product [Sepia pharaonis]